MATVALVARLILAAVLGVAGAAKLADRRGTAAAVVDFGFPSRVAQPAALVIPVVEFAATCLLLPASTALAGLALSLSLILLFAGVIATSLARGRAPNCHCFGQLHSEPASWRTLARNGVLAAIGAVGIAAALEHRSLSAVAWAGRLDATATVALVVGLGSAALVAGGSMAFVSLLRSYGKVLARLERVEHLLTANGFELDLPEPELGLEPGTPAPAFERLDELLAPGLPLLLLFTSPHCGPCTELLPLAAGWQRDHADVLTLAFAVDGAPDEVRAEAERFGLERVLADDELELYTAFRANGTPSAVLISADGRIASWLATGSEPIQRLAAGAVEIPVAEPGLPLGADLPDLELAALDGGSLALGELRGRDTLLLFWNPDCGFCRSMHEEILRWEQSSNGDGHRLVVVSSGDEERTRADGFRSLVLLDQGFAAGEAFGAGGTPMAVLLGADGRIASALAGGAEAVMALVSREQGIAGGHALDEEGWRAVS